MVKNFGDAAEGFGNKCGYVKSYYVMAHPTGTHIQLLAASALTEDGLLGLELKVAKRADQIAHNGARGLFQDIEYWLQAERDVLASEQPGQRLIL